MTSPSQSEDPSSSALRQTLEALTDEELENDLTFHIWLKPDCPSEIRRIFARRKEVTREVLESRQARQEKLL